MLRLERLLRGKHRLGRYYEQMGLALSLSRKDRPLAYETLCSKEWQNFVDPAGGYSFIESVMAASVEAVFSGR